jgi:hypothetical protein
MGLYVDLIHSHDANVSTALGTIPSILRHGRIREAADGVFIKYVKKLNKTYFYNLSVKKFNLVCLIEQISINSEKKIRHPSVQN